jgi:hypothetical protein
MMHEWKVWFELIKRVLLSIGVEIIIVWFVKKTSWNIGVLWEYCVPKAWVQGWKVYKVLCIEHYVVEDLWARVPIGIGCCIGCWRPLGQSSHWHRLLKPLGQWSFGSVVVDLWAGVPFGTILVVEDRRACVPFVIVLHCCGLSW